MRLLQELKDAKRKYYSEKNKKDDSMEEIVLNHRKYIELQLDYEQLHKNEMIYTETVRSVRAELEICKQTIQEQQAVIDKYQQQQRQQFKQRITYPQPQVLNYNGQYNIRRGHRY